MAIEVSVIIVSWNTWDMLRDCIQSVMDQTTSPYEVIVVDNDSHDGSAANVTKTFPDVKLITNSENRGFAAANNQGLEIASGRYILALNPDTLVLDGAIDTMIKWMDENPDIGCGGCQVLEDKDTIQKTCFSDPNFFNLLFVQTGLHRVSPASHFWGRAEYSWWDRHSEMDVDVVSGMFMLIPMKVVEKVGGMDDAFFVYAEEADWCRRIRQAGFRCVFSPRAQIMHRDGGGKSTFQIRPKMYVQLQKSQLIYARKHSGLVGFLSLKSLYVAAMIARYVLFGMFSLLTGRERFQGNAQLAAQSLSFHLFGKEPVG